ncbi:MAG TPA: ATP-binding protein [Blastocatellia bacterium]|nr:ATP-binding protein [Blastocatellia bacterium]
MAVTATAGKQLAQEDVRVTEATRPSRMSLWPRFGVRARQIALLTLLVAIVVVVTTVANIAYLTGVIINRAEEQAHQLTSQLDYAIQQELTHEVAIDELNPYAVLAREHSGVRGLMESIIVTSRPITYLYVSNVSGKIITDKTGKFELAANRHMIGEVPTNRPELSQLADKSAYVQLFQIFFGEPVYEYRKRISDEALVQGTVHIGISASVVRGQLQSPILTNMVIGFLAILGAAVVAISSANLLLRPLEAISSSIDSLGMGAPAEIKPAGLPHDEVVTGVTTRIKQLGERLAGERSELEIMRGRLRQVISHLEERLVLINREGRVILTSPDAEQILGLNEMEITGLPIDETLGMAHPLVELVERAFAERRSVARTTIRVPGSVGPRQLLASVQYIEDAGEPVGALISLRDYESFQRFESQWDLSKKLADLGRITSGIAHEVKNPLNAMVIHLEILRSKLESGAGDPTPQIEILDSEIKRLDRVVATFLNFTRPVEMRMQPLDLNTIVSQVVALASTEANERGVTVNRELADEPLIIKGDSDLLKQALLNIIINGCQSMPEGGPLRVITQRGADGSATIKVSDRGVGIAPEARDRIFTLYHTTKKGGTGIGLAQAFRAVQLHNGFIRFESEVGVGTTFEIVLPAMN